MQIYDLSESRSARRTLQLTRRRVLRQLATVPIWASMPVSAFASTGNVVQDMVAAVLDLIIPPDSTPAASELGVHLSLLGVAQNVPNYPELISQGLGWLEQMARENGHNGFLEMPPEQQEALLTTAFSAPLQTLPRVFAQRLRDDAMTLYYSNPRAFVGLGFDGPIQPTGYPDFDKAPT